MTTLLDLAGSALIVAGVASFSVPIALIVAGSLLLLVSYMKGGV